MRSLEDIQFTYCFLSQAFEYADAEDPSLPIICTLKSVCLSVMEQYGVNGLDKTIVKIEEMYEREQRPWVKSEAKAARDFCRWLLIKENPDTYNADLFDTMLRFGMHIQNCINKDIDPPSTTFPFSMN